MLSVSVSGYYAWHKRVPSDRVREDGRLCERISDIFVANRCVYGSPRIHAELRALGIRCSRKRVIRLMQQLDLSVRPPRRQMSTTCRKSGQRPWLNVLDRQFEAERPNSKWVTDVTAIWTQEGWLYLAIVLDLFSRMIVGWSMGTHHDEHLVEEALSMALVRRLPADGLLHHSDQGSEYTSLAYQAILEHHRIQVSMSRVGQCYDNAVAESFFSSLKGECVFRQRFRSRQQARQAVFEYIECFYNRLRRHSTLQYLSPFDFERSQC